MGGMAKYPAVRDLFTRALGDSHRGEGVRVAIAVGVTEATITRWRKGESRPGAESWDSLAQALGVTVDEIRLACGGPNEGEKLAELLRAVEGLTAEVADLRRRLDERG